MNPLVPNIKGLSRFTVGAGRLALVAAAVLLVTAVFAADKALPLYKAFRTRAATAEATDARGARLVAFHEGVNRDVDQFEGRSFFFTPPRPIPPPPPPPPKIETVDLPPPPPPPITKYEGPSIIGVAAGYVWFSDGKKMRIGGETENNMRVVSLYDAPWTARIEWKGVEFDVPFVPRDSVVKSGADKNKPGGAWEIGGTPPPAPTPAKAADKPGDKPADKPGEKPADKPAEKPAEKPGDKAPDVEKKPDVKPPEPKPPEPKPGT